ncbi:hypothetical protein [Candidatus Manganitrophus noduliformans]|uniref:Uncharacterized protein n=1 Tax=Candidatus Manganitrophus noduliformans TaxID=2606439 RepID=A0A7X6IA28_9BACT|nr:hypothetical protein [Candidatus Manganitrophus noduliformans]NKE70056.1 hypothetical protein [Candidatus Manganitrophus noduliformans]
MMKFCAVVFLSLSLLAFLPNGAEAQGEDDSPKKPTLNAAVLIGVYEGLFALNSGLAALSPRGYGAAGLVLLPLTFSQSGGSKERIAGGSLFAGLCVYNLVVPDRRDLSRSQIFVHNMIGWHLFALGVGATSFFSDDKKEKTQHAFNLGLNVGPEGPMLVARYLF